MNDFKIFMQSPLGGNKDDHGQEYVTYVAR